MTYVNPTPKEIGELTQYLLLATGLPVLDGNPEYNRGWARAAVKKFDGIDNVKQLIVWAMQDPFHAKNLTSFRYILNNGVRIFNDARFKEIKSKPQGTVIE